MSSQKQEIKVFVVKLIQEVIQRIKAIDEVEKIQLAVNVTKPARG